MQIIFVRHGQTSENAAKQYLGHSNPSLNEHGRQQIIHFAKIFPNFFREKITSFYCSDLKRAQETAEIIRESLDIAPPVLVSALREVHFGDWELLTYEEIMKADAERVTAWIDNPFELSPPNGETLLALGKRFDNWFEELLEKSSEKETVLIVCHGGPIRWFRSKWLMGDERQFWKIEATPHGTGLTVEYNKEAREFTNVKLIQ
jgi:alpha-ribazole phosphatase